MHFRASSSGADAKTIKDGQLLAFIELREDPAVVLKVPEEMLWPAL
jgi:hypothetical protein